MDIPLLVGVGVGLGTLWISRRFPAAALAAIDGTNHGGVRLEFPLHYDMLAPLSMAADGLSLMTVGGLKCLAAALIATLLLLAGLAARPALKRLEFERAFTRAVAAFGGGLAVLAAFLAWAALAPRPSVYLHRSGAGSPEVVIWDAHSHTDLSWDGRKGFDVEANAAWHRRLGYDAGFVTDHNVMAEGLPREIEGFFALRGEELSLDRMHLVVLGNRTLIDNRSYDGRLEGIGEAIRDASKSGGLAVASLPEYRRSHWERIGEFARDGAAFEVANGSPKALGFGGKDLEEVLKLARAAKLAVLCASDSHGWGSTAPCWNVTRLKGGQGRGPEGLEAALIESLRREPSATSVLVRSRTACAFRSASPRRAFWLGIWAFAAAWILVALRRET